MQACTRVPRPVSTTPFATFKRAVQRGCPKTYASAAQDAPVGEKAKHLPNPLLNTQGLYLTRVNGVKVLVREAIEGKVVLGLLRHAGCPLCWEQAKNLISLRPQFAAAGFKLMLVTIGDPAGGKTICDTLGIPPELLYLETTPNRPFYKALELKSGFWAMFGKEAFEGWKTKDRTGLNDVLRSYKMIAPKTADDTTQMGGLFVFDGPDVLYAFQDPGVGLHAPNKEVLAACCATA